MTEPFWKSNSSFNASGVQIYLDSTSLSAMKTCWRKYYFQMRHGLVPKKPSPDLSWGLLIHEAVEIFHDLRSKGKDHDQALLKTLKIMLVKSDLPELTSEAEKPQKTRKTLLRSIVWLFDTYKDDHLQTYILANGKPATELSFRMKLPFKNQKTEDDYYFCGHMDRVVVNEESKEIYIEDHKSTKTSLSNYFFQKFNPNTQMSGYTIAGEVHFGIKADGVVINGIQTAKEFSRFSRQKTHRTKEQLDDWLISLKEYILTAEDYAEKFGDEPWPINDTACHQYGACQFLELCTSERRMWPGIIQRSFKRQVWNPRESREN